MDELEPWQADKLLESVVPMLAYLGRLEKRMAKRGFPPQDKLYRLVRDAENAVHKLRVELHYRSCEHGGGRPQHRTPPIKPVGATVATPEAKPRPDCPLAQ